MPKRTITEICQRHGITRDVWNAAKSKGINAWNDDELAAHLSKRRERIPANAELSQGKHAPPPDETPSQTLERIENELRNATVSADVKILKDKLDGLKRAVEVRRMSGDLVPVGEVKENIVKIVSSARGELLKMAADLPPRLEGMPTGKVQKIIRDEVIAVLTRLSDEGDKLYS